MVSNLKPQRQLSAFRRSVWLLLFFLGTLLLFVGCGGSSKQATTSTGPRLSLLQDTYDFGTVSNAQKVVKEVEFTNSGAQPLMIKDVLPVPPPEGG